ncbi:hypothetical protein ES319_A07G066900v1 [Gossypium barbadense]|uniref:Uncharacterized protein n=2 Tax=Gossypium TaxID=3633 RepID=A0A5J5V064_GOSBA|nr:hypothetical protein ES319_A07G066900v1 [Gossypium barbadense]TYH09111.1 hypothetical protein ES288_A07G069800v1 [Gossypium darwinii]
MLQGERPSKRKVRGGLPVDVSPMPSRGAMCFGNIVYHNNQKEHQGEGSIESICRANPHFATCQEAWKRKQ